MQASERKSHRHGLLNSDLVLHALESGISVAFINVIGALVAVTHLAELCYPKFPFADWSPIVCAIWALLVLNSGTFPVQCPSGNRARGVDRCR